MEVNDSLVGLWPRGFRVVGDGSDATTGVDMIKLKVK
jgi:hypothetical protein